MKYQSYKQKWLDAITKEIELQDKLAHNYHPDTSPSDRLYSLHRASTLRKFRRLAKEIHGMHFVPKRFPSAKFISLSLVFTPNS